MTCLRCAVLLVAFGALLAGCGTGPAASTPAAGGATPATAAANARSATDLPLADTRDAVDAHRGFIARPIGKVLGPDSAVLVDFDAFQFEQGPAPATVNPSLWRHAVLNAEIGLFKVTDGIWQLRGFDLANMTLIQGKTGWIVVDPLTSKESAAAAIAFARAQLGNTPVSAVIFTHSHLDHFGGVLGVLSAAEAAQRQVPVIAPQGFMEEATSENVLVGTAMGRRSAYQFGKDLPRSAAGFVDGGLGKGLAYGSFGVLPPTQLIAAATEEVTLDGVRFVFHNVPGAEAPAELTFSLPEQRAYCGAENVVQTMHNLLPIRGAKVRDALRWSRYLDEALEQTADADVMFAQHNWPVWGRARISALLTAHRDTYRYIHDQTVRLMNAGYTISEVADRVHLPPSLAASFGSRGYYGDVRHNVRAVYQFYLGHYDGNPAHLDPLPPEASAAKYVALAGGADQVLAAAQQAFDAGDYRWAAELLDRLVFAVPDQAAARELLAKTYDQLGYGAESATWRNAYLTGAMELRNGPPKKGVNRAAFLELLARTPIERFLEAMAAGLDGPAAADAHYKINLVLSDRRASYVLWIENAVLHHARRAPAADANATLTLTQPLFVRLMAGTADMKQMLLGKDVSVQGSLIDLVQFFRLIDKAPGTFAIVTP